MLGAFSDSANYFAGAKTFPVCRDHTGALQVRDMMVEVVHARPGPANTLGPPDIPGQVGVPAAGSTAGKPVRSCARLGYTDAEGAAIIGDIGCAS
jgi:hypothetical protein